MVNDINIRPDDFIIPNGDEYKLFYLLRAGGTDAAARCVIQGCIYAAGELKQNNLYSSPYRGKNQRVRYFVSTPAGIFILKIFSETFSFRRTFEYSVTFLVIPPIVLAWTSTLPGTYIPFIFT